MLTAADIGAGGPRGMLRAQGLALLFAQVLRTWVEDDDPGLARTMAALDRALARGQRWSGFLDDLCRIPAAPAALRPRRRRRARRCRRGHGRGLKRPSATCRCNRSEIPRYTGTRTVARKPPSGLSDSMMSPPWERAMSRAMASPRPVPPSS